VPGLRIGPLTSIDLVWGVEGQAGTTRVRMQDDGLSGTALRQTPFTAASIPPQASASILSYRIEAVSGTGKTATYPPRPGVGTRVPAYLCEVDDAPPLDNGSADYRLIMTKADMDNLRNRDVRSNVMLNATFIGDGEIHHMVALRYRGETSRNLPRKAYRIEFPPEDTFQGIRVLTSWHRMRWAESSRARFAIFFRAISSGGSASLRSGMAVNLYFQRGVQGGIITGRTNVDPLYVRKDHLDQDFLTRYFGGGDGGNLYRAIDPQSGVGTGDLSYRGPTRTATSPCTRSAPTRMRPITPISSS